MGTTGSLNLDSSAAINNHPHGIYTYGLSADSIAINNADDTANNGISIPTTDQRGATRTGATDIGAFEYEGGITPLDSIPPTVSVIFPTTDEATSTTMTLVASASDDSSMGGISFYVDGVLQGNEDTSSPYSVDYDTTATTTGTHTTFAVARDSANNYATSTAVSFIVDNVAPTVSISSPVESVEYSQKSSFRKKVPKPKSRHLHHRLW